MKKLLCGLFAAVTLLFTGCESLSELLNVESIADEKKEPEMTYELPAGSVVAVPGFFGDFDARANMAEERRDEIAALISEKLCNQLSQKKSVKLIQNKDAADYYFDGGITEYTSDYKSDTFYDGDSNKKTVMWRKEIVCKIKYQIKKSGTGEVVFEATERMMSESAEYSSKTAIPKNQPDVNAGCDYVAKRIAKTLADAE